MHTTAIEFNTQVVKMAATQLQAPAPPAPNTTLTTPLFLQPLQPRHTAAAPKPTLNKEQQEEVHFAFNTLAGTTGFVNRRQLKVALRALGFPVKKADVLALLRQFGEEDNEQLDLNVFQKVVAVKLAERSPEEEMARAFQLFDVHGLGKIDMPALRKVVRALQLDIPDSDLEAMVHEFDLDGDGMINQQEFMAIMSATEDS